MEFYKLFHNRTDFENLWRWSRLINESENIDEYINLINKHMIVDATFDENTVHNVSAYFTIGKE